MSSLPLLNLEHPSSPALGHQRSGPQAHGLASGGSIGLVLRLSSLDWNATTGSLGPSAYRQRVMGPLSLHNCISHFLIINLFYIVLVLFLWRTD